MFPNTFESIYQKFLDFSTEKVLYIKKRAAKRRHVSKSENAVELYEVIDSDSKEHESYDVEKAVSPCTLLPTALHVIQKLFGFTEGSGSDHAGKIGQQVGDGIQGT
jgi:hypothetical protein